MITWNEFVWFALPSALLWATGAAMALKEKSMCRTSIALTVVGLCVYLAFIVTFWMGLHRPPLRTLGETRLWYSFFMMLSGLLTYAKWHYRWILLFSTVVALIFVAINLVKPEIHEQSLMPALQSFWFIPHVTVYIFSYSVLGCAFILALAGITQHSNRYFPTVDQLIYVGMAFLTFGMLSGSLWAKEAWGNYWSWDPKETWAAITWSVYLLYIHWRLYGRGHDGFSYALVFLGFIFLQMCWYGVDFLPSAKESMHVYGRM